MKCLQCTDLKTNQGDKAGIMGNELHQFKKQKLHRNEEQTSKEMDKKYGIGAKLLSQMGYVPGKGLGSGGRGISNPIEAAKRPQGKVGLGMFAAAASMNEDGYSSTSSVSSSDDEGNDNDIPKMKTKFISFNKKGTATLNNSERLRIISQLQSLKIGDSTLSISPKLIDQIKTKTNISKETNTQLLDIIHKLEHIETRLSSLSIRLPDLHKRQQTLRESSKLLSQIDNDISNQDYTETLLQEHIDTILQLPDDDIMDILMSKLLKRVFLKEPYMSDNQWILKANNFQKIILPTIDILQYRINEDKFINNKLNKTQTILFKIVFDKINGLITNDQWTRSSNDTILNPKSILALLINYETVLKYINCYEYILNQTLLPILMQVLNRWDIMSQESNIDWIRDFVILIPPEKIEPLIVIITNKFNEYCIDWYHRNPLISMTNVNFIKEIIGEDKYYDSVRRKLTSNLVEQLWEKYFDLLYDLDGDEEQDNSGNDTIDSMYVLRFILKCRYILHPQDFDTIIKASFNEINKFIFDWIYYYRQDRKRCVNWFHWFLNNVYKDGIQDGSLTSLEITNIKRSQAFIDKITDNTDPIHDEGFQLIKVLEDGYESETVVQGIGKEYTVESIPMRKVAVTFKEVVEDYCIAKGYLLKKLDNKYTDISYGSDQSMLVPVYQIKQGNKNKYVAIKDDILWVEDDNDKYIPTYLHDFKV